MKGDSGGMSSRYKDVVTVFEKNLKYLESVGVDLQLLQDYKKVISYLKGKSLVEAFSILDKKPQRGGGRKDAISSMTSEEIARLTLKDIKQKISSPEVTRASIEKVASVRFGVTKSGLSSLKSRDALIEKMNNLLSNEGVHEIISRAVTSEDESKDSPKG
jgi:hypothetical protein